MRAFVILGLLAAANAQYQYTAQPTQQQQLLHYAAGSNAPTHGTTVAAAPIVNENAYNKEFYSYVAPEEDFNDASSNQRIADFVKKNLRVVFIKGPENQGLENAVLQLANTAAEQRTQIYVLNKQTDIADLANKLNDLQQQSQHKPDVHFIKYRTQADAALAQQAIQAQYDTLPGPTIANANDGIANVLDFRSGTSGVHDESVEVRSDNTANVPVAHAYNPAQQAAAYLPPGRRFKK